MDKKLYLECACNDFNDLIRVWYWNDDGFETYYVSHRVNKWPTSNDDPSARTYNTTSKITLAFYKFKNYISTVRDAILGNTIYQTCDTMLDKTEAIKLAKFILQQTKQQGKGI